MLSHCRPTPTVGDQRKDAKGKDTFALSDWWRCNSGELPDFACVLRAVLTNTPNSCPPERLFSMFNATFGEDQQYVCVCCVCVLSVRVYFDPSRGK